MRIYLAGGLHGDWQDRVKQAVPGHAFIDPRTHGLEDDPQAYTAWDLMGVARCDMVFAYLSPDNPSGIGMAYEMGYAKALGKPVIFVDGRIDQYTRILQCGADLWACSWDNGIEYLRSFVGQP